MEIKLRLFLITTLISVAYSNRCYERYTTSRQTCTWIWNWSCKRVSVHRVRSKCCDGWDGSDCSTPKCHKGFSKFACDISNEGFVQARHGVPVTNSGGTCIAPSVCVDCNPGYYPVTYNNGYCKACPKPEHCKQPVCTNEYDVECEYCEGEHRRKRLGYNVYTGLPDNTTCQRACSWKKGARCFPGSCSNTTDMILDKDCKCAIGFGGPDCATANSYKMPTITNFFLTLQGNNPTFVADKALGYTFWTSITNWKFMSFIASAHYKPEFDSSLRPNYIINYTIGIEHMQIDLTLSRGKDVGKLTRTGECNNFNENCEISHAQNIGIYERNNIFKGSFIHGDRLEYKVSAKNGGEIIYEDRSNLLFPTKQNYMLKGITTFETLVVGVDVLQPDHCFEQHNSCPNDALSAIDFLTQLKLTVFWSGWSDIDSGIDKYEFEVHYLETKTLGGPLTYKKKIFSGNASSNQTSKTLDLKDPGPYSVEILTYDRAGNFKIARRIILFDNASVVELNGAHMTKVKQAQENGWITKYNSIIEITWSERFLNKKHSIGGWLNDVEEVDYIPRDLEDRKGRSSRTIDKIDNIMGITRFDIAYTVELKNSSTHYDFSRVPDEYFHLEKMIYDNEEFIDGKKITYFIRGVDAVEQFAEDNVTVMIDLSPPVIQNLWLTKGDLVNISVHSVLELEDIT